MATKKICDRCGAEITGLSTYQYEGKLTYELCCSCAYHLGRWLDGKEQMVGERGDSE